MRLPRIRASSSRAAASSTFARASSSARAQVLREEARVLDRDRRLIGEGAERRELVLEAHAGAKARLDVERADRPSDRRSAPDRDARDRLDHQLMHAHGLREALVVARARRDDGLAPFHDALGDGAREARVRVVSARAVRAVCASSVPCSPMSSTKPRSAPSSATAWSVTRWSSRGTSCSVASSRVISRMRARRSSVAPGEASRWTR